MLEELLIKCRNDPYGFFTLHSLKNLQIECHPDKWPGQEKLARDAFVEFGALYEESKKSEVVNNYRIVKHINKGDTCDVFKLEKNGQYFIGKKPYVKVGSILKSEFEFCKKMQDLNEYPYNKLLPSPVEFTKDLIVYKWNDDIISGQEVIQKYPNLHSRHVVWMLKRALMTLGYVHNKGYINGAITPDHLLFGKENHGILLAGWIHSGKIGDDIKIVPAKWKSLYPKFASKNKKLCVELDIYMLGKSMSLIGTPNMHKRIKNFCDTMCYENIRMIPKDCWKLHDDLSEIAKSIFGKVKFEKL